ncbi:hypothetical protein RN001_003123 [Aquatica leii]|uniref:Uncharacterized protein n=1 Tax=Aquatica leii TaxID=1421715 RepID=A0AAN7Q986_9COLE|nr:hypothetical protein RN001_003123 [Aquatica leii]
MPLQTTDDFDSFEQKLQYDNICNKLNPSLVSVGGNDLRSCVANMMRRLMSDSLGEMFSYLGKTINDTKKLLFSKHKLCSSVHVAARKLFKDATDDKIKILLCNWLKEAKTRRTRRDKRYENQNVRMTP